jgi:hypothetical protein
MSSTMESRWRAQDNRVLLRNFFDACQTVLHEGRDSDSSCVESGSVDGREDAAAPAREEGDAERLPARAPPTVTVTLVRGQGGTAADSNHAGDESWARPASDSWQVAEHAGAAGLVLVSATPFDAVRWKRRGYTSRGHRKAIKGAPVESALEHRFVRQCDALPNAAPYFGNKPVW